MCMLISIHWSVFISVRLQFSDTYSIWDLTTSSLWSLHSLHSPTKILNSYYFLVCASLLVHKIAYLIFGNKSIPCWALCCWTITWMSEVVLTSKGHVNPCIFYFLCLLLWHCVNPHAVTAVVFPAVISPLLSDTQQMIDSDSCVLLFDLICSAFLCIILIHGADP